ncbi:hypothetical protein AB836_01520 [Rickettsiales bacterium (ex Bugula neritina AB1)]|nr:hypothetical protein AB836_01520 [Rickettsiales bacterium (ex Bugula neritina AB1)]
MPRINQLVKYPRKKKVYKNNTIFKGHPQKAMIVTKILVLSPKKPNSANRKAAKGKVRVKNKYGVIKTVEKTAYINGEGHSIKPNAKVLIKNGGPQDVPGVSGGQIIRGPRDALPPTVVRNQGRSHVGVKKPKGTKKQMSR